MTKKCPRRHGCRALVAEGSGWTQMPVASVEMQKAVANASFFAASTTPPAVIPASSTHRHIVPRSRSRPSRAKRSSWR